MTTDLTVDTPNLDALLAEYGMTRQEGLVIENDSNYYAYGYPQTYLLPSLSSNDITAGVTDGMYVFTPVAQGIVKGDSTRRSDPDHPAEHQQHGLFHAGHRRAGGKRSQRPL